MGHEYCSRLHSQNLHHHHHHHQVNQRPSAIFLPMLCSRPSIIKDVHGLPRNAHQNPSSKSSSDPLSPKISCIGQVKRKNKVNVFPNPHRALANSANIVNYAKLKRFFSTKYLAGAGAGAAAEVAKGFAGCGSMAGNRVGAGHVADEGARGFPGCGSRSGNRVGAGHVAEEGAKGSSGCGSRGGYRAGSGHVAEEGANGSSGCGSRVVYGGGAVRIVDLDPPLPVVKRRPIKAQEGSEAVSESESSLWKRRSGGTTLKGLQIHHLHHPKHHLQPTTV